MVKDIAKAAGTSTALYKRIKKVILGDEHKCADSKDTFGVTCDDYTFLPFCTLAVEERYFSSIANAEVSFADPDEERQFEQWREKAKSLEEVVNEICGKEASDLSTSWKNHLEHLRKNTFS